MSNEGTTYNRLVKNFISEIANVGGLYTIIYVLFTMLYWFF